jgi:hypothetical protein
VRSPRGRGRGRPRRALLFSAIILLTATALCRKAPSLLGLGEQHGPVRPARYWALLACVFYQAPPAGPEMTQCGSMSAVEAELSRDAVSVALVEMETEAPSTRKEIAA